MTSGDLTELTSGSYHVVIGQQLATLLGVEVGDEVVLVLVEAVVTVAGVVPRVKAFTVAGIFDAGMYEYDRGLVFTSFDDAARLFKTRGEATGVRLAIPDLYSSRDVVRSAAQDIANERGKNLSY